MSEKQGLESGPAIREIINKKNEVAKNRKELEDLLSREQALLGSLEKLRIQKLRQSI